VVDFVTRWSTITGLPVVWWIHHIAIAKGKYFQWKERYGRVNEHNAKVPRDHWLEDWERQAIIAFHERYPLEGYRRLTLMMLDQDIVAVSPSSVYRVLRAAGVLDRAAYGKSRKGTGFEQPMRPHQHWHCDVTYINIAGTFFICARY
jgi:putative transposase